MKMKQSPGDDRQPLDPGTATDQRCSGFCPGAASTTDTSPEEPPHTSRRPLPHGRRCSATVARPPSCSCRSTTSWQRRQLSRNCWRQPDSGKVFNERERHDSPLHEPAGVLHDQSVAVHPRDKQIRPSWLRGSTAATRRSSKIHRACSVGCLASYTNWHKLTFQPLHSETRVSKRSR